MPWHLSKSDPRKVYDSRHEVVCVCHTAEQALLIVASVNDHPQSIPLREPAPEPHAKPLETFHHDDCCTKYLMMESRDEITRWHCPKCGCEWLPSIMGDVKHWNPMPATFIIK